MLTGKDVYEAVLFGEADIAGKWNKLSTYDKHVYELAASVLNGTHIAPLQGLVRDYHAALVDAHQRKLNAANAFALEQRKKVLLGEEI